MGTALIRVNPFKLMMLALLFALGAWFLDNELIDSATRERTGESAIRTAALITHLIFATPLLLLPPFQFNLRMRVRRPAWHRGAGRRYPVSAIISATLAVYLGVAFDSLGRRVPVTIFAVLCLCFVVPLLAVETWLTWMPALRATLSRKVAPQDAG